MRLLDQTADHQRRDDARHTKDGESQGEAGEACRQRKDERVGREAALADHPAGGEETPSRPRWR